MQFLFPWDLLWNCALTPFCFFLCVLLAFAASQTRNQGTLLLAFDSRFILVWLLRIVWLAFQRPFMWFVFLCNQAWQSFTTFWRLKLICFRNIWTAKACAKIRESKVCGSTSNRTMVMPYPWLCFVILSLELF